eukprot:545853-Prymnesium_polylepis.1
MYEQIHTCFSIAALSYAAPSLMLHFRLPRASRAWIADAHFPLAVVSPSGFTSVMPSMGVAPTLATARYKSTWVLPARPLPVRKPSSMPFCMNTRSSLRCSGVASTMAARSLFLAAQTRGENRKSSESANNASDSSARVPTRNIDRPRRWLHRDGIAAPQHGVAAAAAQLRQQRADSSSSYDDGRDVRAHRVCLGCPEGEEASEEA